MDDVIIRVEGLGKKYRIRHERAERYTALRDVIADKLRGGFSNSNKSTEVEPSTGAGFANIKSNFPAGTKPRHAPSVEDFWALRDVSFEVKRGEVVGIIGRNGAGKSTLLKILSRITEPTEGRVALDGRVASLLEVGTGFHPELTGRENIFLNGAILGMTRAEIRRKFEEIVSFAEVEKFLDTPVKRYSSGMYVRLAFSVAAHLEPEILIVDEVLAVGDAAFQKKCLEKLSDSGREGRTVLFVTHNMEAAVKLCKQGILMADGGIVTSGGVDAVIEFYKRGDVEISHSALSTARRSGMGGVRLNRVSLINKDGTAVGKIKKMESASILVVANVAAQYQNDRELIVGIGIDTDTGYRLVTFVSSWSRDRVVARGGKLSVRCNIPFLPFLPGIYRISVSILCKTEVLDMIEHCIAFEVVDISNIFHGDRSREQGYVDLPFKFELTS